MAEADVIPELLEQVTRRILRWRRLPESTYRLQFHAGFTFQDARRLVPYLHELGITDCYTSPYLKARPGSKHGYDIQDHRVLNPEIGTEEDYTALVEALHEQGMGQILDMVPNHMGIVGNENPDRHRPPAALYEHGPAEDRRGPPRERSHQAAPGDSD
jgi:(1->4)-alpha-D-glucan 1-alpha-D-glucosylmutase